MLLQRFVISQDASLQVTFDLERSSGEDCCIMPVYYAHMIVVATRY